MNEFVILEKENAPTTVEELSLLRIKRKYADWEWDG